MKKSLVVALAVLGGIAAFAAEPNTWWVAKEDANASDELVTGRGTEVLPFRTIQAALDNPDFVAGDTVIVKPGEYAEGAHVASTEFPVTNCVHITKTVYLRAADLSPQGRATTCILGKRTPVVSSYCKDSVRCVYVGSNAGGTVIEGFTLRDGMAYYSSKAGAYTGRECCRGGGVFVAGAKKNVYVVDCAISNCLSGIGVAMHGGTAVRCVIENLTSKYLGGVVFSGSYAFACAAKGSTYATDAVPCVMDDDSVAVNCTFVEHGCRGMANGTYSAYNCLLAGNKSPNVDADARTNDCYAAVANNDTLTTLGLSDDFRLRPTSGAIGVGRTAHRQVLIDMGVPEGYLAKDLSGRDIDWSAETMNAGAEQGVATVATLSVADPNGELVCEAAGETRVVSDLEPWQITVQVNAEAKRNPKGFTVNGAEHLFSSYPGSETISLKVTDLAEPSLVLAPMAADWYVDAVGGNDANNGFTPGTAKLTLADAMTNTAVTAGDTVKLLPGTYDQGVMKAYDDDVVWNRVIVPANVTLTATGTPEETLIVGAAAPQPTDKKGYGLGPDAVRCVFLNSGSVLDGVTLTGGHTDAVTSDESPYSKDDGLGGGVTGYGLVKNCLITNNFAYNGAGGGLGTFVKCRILNNKSVYRSGALWRCGVVDGCVIAGNSSDNYAVMYPSAVYNCTIGYNPGACSVYFYQPAEGAYKVFNSILDRVDGNNKRGIYWHCVINTNTVAVSEEKLNYEGVAGSVGVAGTEALLLDADYRPLPGSPAIDIGDAAKSSGYREADDLAGNPRILNGGMIDAGAFEYDWRVDYSKDLGKRIIVTDVSSNVVETADGKVEVPEGFLKLDWPSKGKPLVFNAQVAGEGLLAVNVNGEPFATLSESDEPEIRIPETLDLTKLEFVFTGSGNATLAGFRRESGALLLVR